MPSAASRLGVLSVSWKSGPDQPIGRLPVAFSTASIDQLFDPAQLQRALHYETDTFASVYLQNNGNGTFTASPLPNVAQIAPIRGIIAADLDDPAVQESRRAYAQRNQRSRRASSSPLQS